MANEGFIIVPMETQLRVQAEWHEYQAAKKVWRRPWVYGQRKRMVGKVKEIHNIPFVTKSGEKKRWNPFMVACFAVFEAGVTAGFDVVRVLTPGDEKEPGFKAIAEVDFSIQQLKDCLDKDSAFYTEVKNGHIRFEDEAANDMPREWVMQNGVFAPEGANHESPKPVSAS